MRRQITPLCAALAITLIAFATIAGAWIFEAFGYLPPNKVVALCTGSQGEPRAALSRIAEDQHPEVTFSPGDRVIYSARTIPGNEKAVGRVINLLIEQESRGADLHAAAAHTPMTYRVTIARTTVLVAGSPHNIPMLLWYPRRSSSE